jgi:hypothetical protein
MKQEADYQRVLGAADTAVLEGCNHVTLERRTAPAARPRKKYEPGSSGASAASQASKWLLAALQVPPGQAVSEYVDLILRAIGCTPAGPRASHVESQ